MASFKSLKDLALIQEDPIYPLMLWIKRKKKQVVLVKNH